jgi:putative oxidoreductase
LALTPLSLVSIVLRVAVSVPFWNSGVLKWDSFPTRITDTAVFLFTDEFKLNLPGGPFPFPAPELSAYAAAMGEVILPVLLILGLFTRFAALGLLAMTAVIQLTIPDGWPIHLTWAAMALGIMATGGRAWSLDRLLGLSR